MAWRDTFLRWFGPGMLGGITLGDWVRLLRDNRFRVSPRHLIRAAAITAQGAQNSVMKRIEDLRYGAAVRDAEIPPPLFVLGHWRSGTTHLHNLLAADERFAFPNNYQALFPHAMLSMSIHEATSANRLGTAAAASARKTAAGTGAMNERGSGPIRVIPCSRSTQRVYARLQWSDHSSVTCP